MGLIPSWAKDMSGSGGLINARAESAATKPAFRDPMKFRRCLVPADCFYEWKRTGSAKQPFCFEVNDGENGPNTRFLSAGCYCLCQPDTAGDSAVRRREWNRLWSVASLRSEKGYRTR